MKYLIVLSCLILSTTTFALSCPNNASVLSSGTLQEILQRCGVPISKNEYTKNVSVAQQWEYYKTSGNQTNTKINILFSKDRVVNIHITSDSSNAKQNLASTTLCGQFVSTGYSKTQVQAACGNPAVQVDLQNGSRLITELTYSGSQNSTLVFEDGKFIELK